MFALINGKRIPMSFSEVSVASLQWCQKSTHFIVGEESFLSERFGAHKWPEPYGVFKKV